MPRSPKGDSANKRFEPRGSAENLLVPECSNTRVGGVIIHSGTVEGGLDRGSANTNEGIVR